MKKTISNNFLCSVFGHNLKSRSLSEVSDDSLICKNCNFQFLNIKDTNLERGPFKNDEINILIRRLFVLKVSYMQVKYAV